MSYLKLCQLSIQGNPDVKGRFQTVFYEENYKGQIITNNVTYPATFQCEIIDWLNIVEFNKLGVSETVSVVPITLDIAPIGSVRQEIFNKLVVQYPTLVI
jgi:hypothetical protein